ncbi:MAG: hypothetical protein K0S33_4048 [Bacteroidetes bacterium]|jgi:hypothetical protein|nr:hypothetical protein [Bacteroidota bacterium]
MGIFIRLKRLCSILLFALIAFSGQAQREFQVSGIILDEDSTSAIPFAYAINKQSGNGAVSDFNGQFTIKGFSGDTLSFSFLGYHKKEIVVKHIKSVNDSTKQFLKVILRREVYSLGTFNVNAFKIKPYEREYMERFINKPRITGINVVESPITAIYDQFSHKGRANRKLAALFEQMLIDEQVAQKFNPEILRRLTGDENIDFEKFKKYCYNVNDYFIINHEGYDLYAPIMDCYKRWKNEGR